jgi:hypothetical protein
MASGSILSSQSSRAVLASQHRGDLQRWVPPVTVAVVALAAFVSYLAQRAFVDGQE